MNWREKIIQNIKDCGQSMIDNAEKIAGDMHYQRSITITCYVDEKDEPPYITIDASFYPEKFIERHL